MRRGQSHKISGSLISAVKDGATRSAERRIDCRNEHQIVTTDNLPGNKLAPDYIDCDQTSLELR